MSLARLIAAALLSAATLAEAQAVPWRATVAAPRPGLPSVAIELGYPGPYVPVASSPVTLRASAGTEAFDGYIGFHFRAGELQTYDTPIIARASLRPGSSWTFSTFATPRKSARVHEESRQPWTQQRAIAIEWRDASMKVLARQSAGIPPWSLERIPLTITNAPAPQRALGGEALARRPGALPAHAQWYAGFSEVVAPLDVWLDLADPVREAILASSREVVLHGLPGEGQSLDTLTRTLLPVTFTTTPGSYRVPWPYATADTSRIAVVTPRSWVAKPGAHTVGSGPLPYMVRTPVATWIAVEQGIARPLPVAEVVPIAFELAKLGNLSPTLTKEMSLAWPGPFDLLRHAPVRITLVLASLLSIAGWLLLRKTPRAAMAALLLFSAAGVLAARTAIRPPSGMYRVESTAEIAPGIVERLETTRSYGASLIAAPRIDAAAMRIHVFDAPEAFKDAEIRTSETPPGMGAVHSKRDWDAVWRGWSRRMLGHAPKVTIRHRDEESLAIDYESPIEIDSIDARWVCGSRMCWGETAAGGRSGRAIIEHAQLLWPGVREGSGWYMPATTRVNFVSSTRDETIEHVWFEPPRARTPQSIVLTHREARSDGSGTFTFALPRALPADASARISTKLNTPSTRVELALPGGTTTSLTPTGRSGLIRGTRTFAIPAAALDAIVAHGGIVEVRITSDAPRTLINPSDSASLEIWEKKP